MGSAAGVPTRTLDCSVGSLGWEVVLLSPRQGLCRSQSKPDLFHTVTHWPNRGWRCDYWCEQFRQHGDCSHVRRVKRQIVGAPAQHAGAR